LAGSQSWRRLVAYPPIEGGGASTQAEAAMQPVDDPMYTDVQQQIWLDGQSLALSHAIVVLM
jgi:hypothetical protein